MRESSCKKTIRDLDVKNKRVLVRVDYNVPLNGAGNIQDTARLRATRETIQYLSANQAACIILLSHLDRPKGKPDPKLSLRPIAETLQTLLNRKVHFVPDCAGSSVSSQVNPSKQGEIFLLENLRFYPEEEKNDETFAKSLASLGNVFIQEAFGTIHRAHASIVGIPKFLPSAIGFLVEKELSVLYELFHHPKPPYLAILGGAKVSDKIGVIRNLLTKVDGLLIGGAMAFTFLKALGFSVGNSKVEESHVESAAKLLEEYPGKIQLPKDVIAASSVEESKSAKQLLLSKEQKASGEWIGFDIGPETTSSFLRFIEDQKPETIFWNGPMGVAEVPEFARGTLDMARALAKRAKQGTLVVVGGGDSVAALNRLGLAGEVSHLSMGGGACLEFLEGKTLPGLAALEGAPCLS